MINLQDANDRTAAAGEYVLGTLSGEDLAVFTRALGQDANLRAEVHAWQDRLLNLSAQAAPVAPSLELWRRIDSALSTANARTQREVRAGRRVWWQQLRVWQGLSGALAAMLVVVLLFANRSSPPPPPPGARYVAVLQHPDTLVTGWLVELQIGGRLRLVPVAPWTAPAGRSMQFWTQAPNARNPVSLGLVRASQPLDVPARRVLNMGPQQLFQITLEPENGSPVDRPTGPILYVGRAVPL